MLILSHLGGITFFDEKDIQTLIKLGLNFSQAKIYLTLLSLREADAKTISKTAKIDSSEVYRVLESLHKRGLIEKILKTRAAEYKAMNLDDSIEILIQRKNRENAEMQKEAEALLKKAKHMEMLKDDDYRISLIPGDEYRKLYSTRIVYKTEKEIVGYSQIERMPIALSYYVDAMKEAADRGVQYRYIYELNNLSDKILKFIERIKKEVPNYQVRFVKPTLFVTFFIFDDKEMSFSTERITGLADSPILSTTNCQLIRVIKDYFELRWNTATEEYPKK